MLGIYLSYGHGYLTRCSVEIATFIQPSNWYSMQKVGCIVKISYMVVEGVFQLILVRMCEKQ